MLGSAEKAARMVADIKSFAAATPFETAGLAQAGKTLLAFGTESQKIVPTLKMLGDVAGGSQEKLGQLTLAFAQISSAGKLQGQDLLQLINAGFNPLQEISRTTGASMADLREQMEKGAISAQMVEDAFRSATSEGGRFFGNTAAQGKTFNGILSTLRDGIADLYRAFGEPVMLALKPILEEAQALAASLQPIVADLGARFAGIVAQVGEIAGTLAKGLLGAFKAGQLGDLFSLALTGAAKLFLGTLATGFKVNIEIIVPLLKAAFQSATALLTDKSLWSSILNQVMSIVFSIRSEIMSAVADIVDMLPTAMRFGADTKSMRTNADADRLQSASFGMLGSKDANNINFDAIVAPIGEAGKSVFGILKAAMGDYIASAKRQPELLELQARLAELATSFDSVSVSVAPVRDYFAEAWQTVQDMWAEEAKVPSDGGGGGSSREGGPPVQTDAWAKVGAFVSSGASQQVSEQRRTNSLMERAVNINSATLDFWRSINFGGGSASWA
jgi:tape measure domain-containing protein